MMVIYDSTKYKAREKRVMIDEEPESPLNLTFKSIMNIFCCVDLDKDLTRYTSPKEVLIDYCDLEEG